MSFLCLLTSLNRLFLEFLYALNVACSKAHLTAFYVGKNLFRNELGAIQTASAA